MRACPSERHCVRLMNGRGWGAVSQVHTAGTVGADRADPGFSRLTAAEEVSELSSRSRCAENRKRVLIRYARSRSDSVRRSGCRRLRPAERLFVRRNCRSRLSKIICGVIFYETLCKADAPAAARAVDSPPEAAMRSNFRLPIASTAFSSSSGTQWTILSQGDRYADDDHQFESQDS